jgi:peptidoglycan/xylan/chitin deacetylase (PgdA/CDA1 family)
MISKGRTCFVSIDVEHDFGSPLQRKELREFQGVENLRKILDIFKNQGISATLFVTGEVLKKYQNKAKEWANNYEIACHTWSHCFWNKIETPERKQEIEIFQELYEKVFQEAPKGFRSPSHLIDNDGIKLLEEKGFFYDSSVVPHYPFFKKYRGYQGRAPLTPYHPNIKDIRKKGEMEILEIPIAGQIGGIPLAGAWIARLPFSFYKTLFRIHCPDFITLSCHSWDILDTPTRKSAVSQFLENLEALLVLLKNKDYQFLNGEQIFKNHQ